MTAQHKFAPVDIIIPCLYPVNSVGGDTYRVPPWLKFLIKRNSL